MQYRPENKAILQAIQDLLMKEIIPKIATDDLLSYKTLVSWNMLGVMIREIEKEAEFLNDEFNSLRSLNFLQEDLKKNMDEFKSMTLIEKTLFLQSLNHTFAKAIRSSKDANTKSEVWSHIKATLKNNLQISNPRFTP